MSKIKYSYNVGGSKLKPQNSGKGKFFAMLFAVLILIAAAIFLKSKFFDKQAEEEVAIANPAVTVKEEKIVAPAEIKKDNEKPKETTEVKQAEKVTEQNTPIQKVVANPAGYDEDFAKLKKYMADTDYQNAKKVALDMLKKYGEADKAGPYYRKIGHFISSLNMKVIKNGLKDKKMVVYRINPGDNLTNIAFKYNFPVDAILQANNLTTTTIHPGRTLKVYQCDWRIEVSKNAKLLYVYDGDDLFALYDIGIGKEGRTPEGEFKITDKIANPDWYAPDGRIVAFGDKENVLGTRWLKLEPINDTDAFNIGYGIHGTWDAGSITKSLSNGCIRMRNEEVEELFTYIPRQVVVKIY